MLAHVDAGKTTLSEAMLYESKTIRKLGRVDRKDTFLDTFDMEKNRGITIFSKEARMKLNDAEITLLDTPGHVDFCAEMERTLQVLDYAVLVISSTDNVTGHTRTLWQLLAKSRIPVFIFVNKMDMENAGRDVILKKLSVGLSDKLVDFTNDCCDTFYENVVQNDEECFEKYMEGNMPDREEIAELVAARKVFPVCFGSALRLEGIDGFLNVIEKYTLNPSYKADFSARIYKISRDEQGSRITHMKITGGTLRVKDVILGEKVNQIRMYSGSRYDAVSEVSSGELCVVTGLNNTKAGMVLGAEEGEYTPLLTPVLNYAVKLPEGTDSTLMLSKFLELEEEEPELHIVWNEYLKEIQLELMGEVQTEIIKAMVKERYGVDIDFGAGHIVYKETIADHTYGVGHFEPLRHYAEVHLVLSPNEPGKGITFESKCSEDVLDKNWQRLIKTHIFEKTHRGVLVGAPLTDVHITLVAGKAHNKHTEGGDFRQATYRALRQGLMEAESVLLEPFYDYTLTVPVANVGRAMSDIDAMSGSCTVSETNGVETILVGRAPVASMCDYQKEVQAYTKGFGRLNLTVSGYGKCHNSEEVIERMAYNPDEDRRNESGSVFCANGSGFVVPWYEVKNYMHIGQVSEDGTVSANDDIKTIKSRYDEEVSLGTEEIDAIIEKTFYANKRDKSELRRSFARHKAEETFAKSKPVINLPKYMLVDGYNVIFAWDELNMLAKENIDAARDALKDILCNYQAMKKINLIVVFDAYRVKGHNTEIGTYHNINVVFTKEAETADAYIEKFSHENGGKYDITVVTSDGLEQIIIRGQGCKLMSAREFKEEVEAVNRELREQYNIL